MPNVSRINGFRPVKHVTGAPYNGQANIYAVNTAYGTALYVGDVVKVTSDGNAAGIPYVAAAAAGDAMVGVIVGIVPNKIDPVSGGLTTGSMSLDTPVYIPASTGGYVLVADSPDVLFEAEGTNAGSAYSFAAADINLNANINAGAGSTTTGNSGHNLDMNTAATTATLQWKVMGLVKRVDNSTGNYAKVLVKPNNHQLMSGTGTAGVA